LPGCELNNLQPSSAFHPHGELKKKILAGSEFNEYKDQRLQPFVMVDIANVRLDFLGKPLKMGTTTEKIVEIQNDLRNYI